MTKSKHDGPTFEAPTAWRRIVMEEGENGELRPADILDVPVSEGMVKAGGQGDSGDHLHTPAEMPDEWRDILHTPASKEMSPENISLLEGGIDPSERTIPGMRIPQLYDDEMVSIETGAGYSIGGDFSGPDVTTVGATPQAPPHYEDFPFSQEPTQPPPPKKNPLIVPQPQEEGFVPPPHSVLSAKGPGSIRETEEASLGSSTMLPAANEPKDELPIATAELDIPMIPEESETPHIEPEALSTDYLDASDLEVYDEGEDTGSFDAVLAPSTEKLSPELSEDTVGLVLEHTPEPEKPEISPTADTISPLLHDIMFMQQEMMEHVENMEERLLVQKETQVQAHHQLQSLATAVAKQSEDSKEQKQSIQTIADGVSANKEELQFQILYDVFQDLLLLYDFVDLRLRSLWEQQGKEHSTTNELITIRDRLIETLKRQELSPIDINDPIFDPATQRALQEVLTSDPGEDGKITRIFRQGFHYKSRVFRPSEVEVKRYPSS